MAASPIFEGSELPIRSGMALQIDIIPATNSPISPSISRRVAIADAPLRDAFRDKYPEGWRRIEARRGFMKESLGIKLKPRSCR